MFDDECLQIYNDKKENKSFENSFAFNELFMKEEDARKDKVCYVFFEDYIPQRKDLYAKILTILKKN